MSENDRKFKVEFTLGKVKSWKMSQKKSENFRNIRALLHAHAHESAFSIGPSAVLFYYPSEGVWVIVPPFPYPPGTAHCPTLPKYCYAGLCIILFIVHWCYTIRKNFCRLNF